MGQDVSQQLRMVQEVSGGVLTLAGQTYRHFVGKIGAGGGDQTRFAGQGGQGMLFIRYVANP